MDYNKQTSRLARIMSQQKQNCILSKKPQLRRNQPGNKKRVVTQYSEQKAIKQNSVIINPRKLPQKQIVVKQNFKAKPQIKLVPRTPKKWINPQESHNSRKVETQPNRQVIQFCQDHNDGCFCMDCQCGRHLCNLATSLPKPHITMRTTYQNSFSKGTLNKIYNQSERNRSRKVIAFENIQDNDFQIMKFKSQSIPVPVHPLLTKQSQYERAFIKQDRDYEDLRSLQKSSRPRDQLNCNSDGSIQTLTTYSQNFVGHKGCNQYVKIKQSYLNNPISFKATSSYNKAFIHRIAEKYKCDFSRINTEKQKQLNRMINRSTCFSSYQKSFQNNMQKTQDSAKGDQIHRKTRVKTLDDCYFKPQRPYTPDKQSLTFVSSVKVSANQKKQSTYHRQFQISNGKVYCPARMKIRSINQSKMSSMKRRFQDNSNFKQFLNCVTKL